MLATVLSICVYTSLHDTEQETLVLLADSLLTISRTDTAHACDQSQGSSMHLKTSTRLLGRAFETILLLRAKKPSNFATCSYPVLCQFLLTAVLSCMLVCEQSSELVHEAHHSQPGRHLNTSHMLCQVGPKRLKLCMLWLLAQGRLLMKLTALQQKSSS